MEEDDLLKDVKDVRFEKEKGKLTKLKIWYLIIIIIFAAAVAAGMWVYISGQDLSWLTQNIPGISQSSNQEESTGETALTWKTYTDTDLGYAFKYPATWDIDVSVTSATGTYNQVSLVRVDPDIISDQPGEISEVEFWTTVYNKKYSAYISQRNKDKNFTSQKSEDITFASKDGKKYTFISTEFAKRQQNDIVIALGDSQTIVLSYLTVSEENENITNILKSFRFN